MNGEGEQHWQQEDQGSSGSGGSSPPPVGRMINVHEGQLRRFEALELLLLSLPRRRRLAKLLACLLFVGFWFACLAYIGWESERVVAVHVEGRNLTREREMVEEARRWAETRPGENATKEEGAAVESMEPTTTWRSTTTTEPVSTTFSLEKTRERLQDLEDTYNRLANAMQEAIEK